MTKKGTKEKAKGAKGEESTKATGGKNPAISLFRYEASLLPQPKLDKCCELQVLDAVLNSTNETVATVRTTSICRNCFRGGFRSANARCRWPLQESCH